MHGAPRCVMSTAVPRWQPGALWDDQSGSPLGPSTWDQAFSSCPGRALDRAPCRSSVRVQGVWSPNGPRGAPGLEYHPGAEAQDAALLHRAFGKSACGALSGSRKRQRWECRRVDDPLVNIACRLLPGAADEGCGRSDSRVILSNCIAPAAQSYGTANPARTIQTLLAAVEATH